MLLRFDEWMKTCLYDPKRGYYTRKVDSVGVGGDFTTTPELTSELGAAVGKWALSEWSRKGRMPLIEMGAGTGVLADQVMKNIGLFARWGLKLGIVEVSEGLRTKQRLRLKKWGQKVQWFSSVEEALVSMGGKALIYSNEFVDAFPVRVFRKGREGWQELYLKIEEGRVSEVWEVVETLPESSVFQHSWPDGQRVEVHESFRRYLCEMASSLREGALLTIDYGEEVYGLYARRLNGSVRAYFMQERYEDARIYQNMGRQDLTADVNFSDLIQWGKVSGLHLTKFTTQRDFIAAPSSGEGSRLGCELGAGSAFKVLVQSKKGS